MQRFKTGDRILILPKFAHLYPGTYGVIVAVMPDPYRPVFTEYTVLFGDGSRTDLFEFQLLEDLPGQRLLIADITFDSSKQAGLPTAGPAAEQQITLQAGTIEIDIKIHRDQLDRSLLGQISERHTNRFIAGVDVSLMKLSAPIITGKTDNLGQFTFGHLFPGKFNIHVLIPSDSLRIFGTIVV
jgi:hypothetical protein